MNAIRQTQLLNKRELENATPPSASWHVDYRDTAWIYIGGIPLDLSEGDVITVFSQYGEPTHLNLIRDRETGKSKGFAFLRYADQRSCDLAVDNLGGADLLGRLLRVDHTRYKKREGEDDDTWRIERLEAEAEAEVRREARLGTARRSSDTETESEAETRHRKRRRPIREERLRIKADDTTDTADEDDTRTRERPQSRRKHRSRRESEDKSQRRSIRGSSYIERSPPHRPRRRYHSRSSDEGDMKRS